MSKREKEWNRRLGKVSKHVEALRTIRGETNPKIDEKIQDDLDKIQSSVNRLKAVALG